METKEIRQRFTGSQHQKYSYQTDENLQDDKKRRLSHSRFWCRIVVITTILPVLFVVVYWNLLADENLLPAAFSMPDPPRLEGPLQPNNHLDIAEKLYEGKVLGPESIAFDHGHLYTGTSDGKIVHIYKGEVKTLATLGKPPCGGYENEPTCGRPLGMRLDSDGYLIVCDTALGIFKINVATGDTLRLLPSKVIIDGRPLNFLNDLDIDGDGNIYFTDTSTYPRRDLTLDMLDGRGRGRLLRYDPLRNSTEVLLENLHFANGVQLSRYEDFVLVAETSRARIMKYHVKGINAGHAEVFVENLPCLPDNIRRSSSGGYWIACHCLRYEGKFNTHDFVGPRPWIRWILSKLPASWLFAMYSPSTMLAELNSQGNIIRSLMDLTGEKVRWLSEVEDDAGTLYVGSFSEPYITRIRLDRLHSITD